MRRDTISVIFPLVVQVYQYCSFFFFFKEDSEKEIGYMICLLNQQVTWVPDFSNFA